MSSRAPSGGPSVLIVDEVLHEASELARGLEEAGYRVELAPDRARLGRRLRSGSWDVVLADRDSAALAELVDSLSEDELPAIILLAAFGSVHEAVEALRGGAFDYLEKPVSEEQVLLAVSRAVEQRALRAENRRLRADLGERFDLGRFTTRDPKLGRVLQTLATVADTRATVLIEGESGTGKTLLARAVHQRSERAGGPFVEVSCGALPPALLESEIFGHARGAFTGATRDRAGKFEAAHGGTLFLDEIATATPELQLRLLRVLQDKSFERVGETRTRTADVRVICATNSELEDEVRAGRFREDLYYRIKVVPVRLPPLRERPGDLVLLAEQFVERYKREHGRTVERLAPACLPALAGHAWPGNVRELEHVIERAVLLAPGPEIRPEDLGLQGGSALGVGSPAPARSAERASAAALQGVAGSPRFESLRDALDNKEREVLVEALRIRSGNRQETARMLGITRSTLFNKMRKHDLLERDFTAEEGGRG